jgi:hypothetical protein
LRGEEGAPDGGIGHRWQVANKDVQNHDSWQRDVISVSCN